MPAALTTATEQKLIGFADWPSLLRVVSRGRSPLWYQAPLDVRPVKVVVERLKHGKLAADCVRVTPPFCDPFVADAAHLPRFFRVKK